MDKPCVKITNCRIKRINPGEPWLIINGDVKIDISGVHEETYIDSKL